jgi:uncharacterized OB-fold protein
MAPVEQTYVADHVLEYPYSRSVGPVVGAFLTALRDGRLVGITGTGGRVIVPPTEYDPVTGEETTDLVDVGPEGTVTTWSWVPHPLPKHPTDVPFAWVLVRLDGADTALLHIVEAPDPDTLRTGMRVRAEFVPADRRIGRIQDIARFVPVESGGAG